MNIPHKKVPADWENELNDHRRVRRFGQVKAWNLEVAL
jgi:hypothetical protein